MTFKKCRNDGCEVLIEVRQTPEGWRPFEESGSKHNCQFSDYAKKLKAQDKDDHGNETISGVRKEMNDFVDKSATELKTYIDHTLKGQSKVKIFYAGDTESLEGQYNEFLATNKVKTQGAQFQLDGDAFAIALYYEEVAKQ